MRQFTLFSLERTLIIVTVKHAILQLALLIMDEGGKVFSFHVKRSNTSK